MKDHTSRALSHLFPSLATPEAGGILLGPNWDKISATAQLFRQRCISDIVVDLHCGEDNGWYSLWRWMIRR